MSGLRNTATLLAILLTGACATEKMYRSGSEVTVDMNNMASQIRLRGKKDWNLYPQGNGKWIVEDIDYEFMMYGRSRVSKQMCNNDEYPDLVILRPQGEPEVLIFEEQLTEKTARYVSGNNIDYIECLEAAGADISKIIIDIGLPQ